MKFLRTFLVWLMLLAIPLQGFAAVSLAMSPADAAPFGMLVADPAVGEHCDGAPEPGTCSTCAACCFGASIAPLFPALDAPSPIGSTPIPYTCVHITAHVSGGLERPPHSLASR